jgi:hypothetical protein
MAHLGAKNITQLFTVAVGTPVTLEAAQYSIPYPLTVHAVPGVGGTILVEYRITPTGSFVAWPAGTVAASTISKLNGPVEALRFTAAVADGVVGVAQ